MLAFCAPPPVDLYEVENHNEDNYVKWFKKTIDGWDVNVFDDPCYGCGSPWCLYHQHRSELNMLLDKLGKCQNLANNQKRFKCYRDGISLKWGVLGFSNRKRCGWCWENRVRVTFPDVSGRYKNFESNEN